MDEHGEFSGFDGIQCGVSNEGCYFDSFTITPQIFSFLKIITDSISI